MQNYLLPRRETGSIEFKMPDDIESDLKRLQSLLKGDPAFTLLGLHTFIESFLRRGFTCFGEEYSFSDLIDIGQQHQGTKDSSGSRFFQEIKNIHPLVSSLSREFGQFEKEDVYGSINRFIQFSSFFGISDNLLVPFKKYLNHWSDKKDSSQMYSQAKEQGLDLYILQKENGRLLRELRSLQRLNQEKEDLIITLKNLGKDSEDQGDPSFREYLKQTRDNIQATRDLIGKKQKYEDYILQIKRLTGYSRSRGDFERSLIGLNPQQEDALAGLSEERDFLVMGGPGSGKTLVLLKALDALVSAQGNSSFVFLTFTNTLVKYNSYLAGILKTRRQTLSGFQNSQSIPQGMATVDAFFSRVVQYLEPGSRIVFSGLVHELVPQWNDLDFISHNDLAEEIEGFIFAHYLTRTQYVVEEFPRSFRARDLSRSQREQVWAVLEKCVLHMAHTRIYSKNFSRIVVLKHLRDQRPDIPKYDYAFIDEIQDLNPIDLKVLKLLTRKKLLMAGDMNQSIYIPGFSLDHAGIEDVLTTVLSKNYRNTIAVNRAAENFRKNINLLGEIGVSGRVGTPVELFIEKREELMGYLADKVDLLTSQLGYHLENISILVPARKHLQTIEAFLNRRGYRCKDLKEKNFRFEDRGILRLSTIHSAKGIDSPAVLLYMPELPFVSFSYDEETRKKLQANLLYVGLTRPMDFLCLFIDQSAAKESLFKSLRAAVEESW